jgi:hypothetical protein
MWVSVHALLVETRWLLNFWEHFVQQCLFISDENIENIFKNLFTPKNQGIASIVKNFSKLKTAQYYLVGKSYS